MLLGWVSLSQQSHALYRIILSHRIRQAGVLSFIHPQFWSALPGVFVPNQFSSVGAHNLKNDTRSASCWHGQIRGWLAGLLGPYDRLSWPLMGLRWAPSGSLFSSQPILLHRPRFRSSTSRIACLTMVCHSTFSLPACFAVWSSRP